MSIKLKPERLTALQHEMKEFNRTKMVKKKINTQLVQVATKTWNVATPPPDALPNVGNLAQYRERQPEGKIKSLENLHNLVRESLIPDGEIDAIVGDTVIVPDKWKLISTHPAAQILLDRIGDMLSHAEQKRYMSTMFNFLQTHPDINNAEDTEDLHQLCIQYLLMDRFIKAAKFKPNQSLSYMLEYDKCSRRTMDIKKSLAMRREDRTHKAGRVDSKITFELNRQATDTEYMKELLKQVAGRRQEEELLLRRKVGYKDTGNIDNIIDVESIDDVKDKKLVEIAS